MKRVEYLGQTGVGRGRHSSVVTLDLKCTLSSVVGKEASLENRKGRGWTGSREDMTASINNINLQFRIHDKRDSLVSRTVASLASNRIYRTVYSAGKIQVQLVSRI